MSEDVKITYETIFELLRNERNKPELQKLEDSFFGDVVEYLKEKKQITLKSDDELFAANDKANVEKQLNNIMKMLKDLYDKRETKIVNMALNKARTGSNIIDTSALLNEEKEFFESTSDLFLRFRVDVLNNLLRAKAPELKKLVVSQDVEQTKTSKDSGVVGNKMVRFLHAVPKFVGKDLEVYGPFEEEDVANVPAEIADILILKQRAEQIQGS